MGTIGRRWSKQVRDLKTGKVYDNVAEAAEALGMSRMSLYRRLNGTYKYAWGKDVDVMWVQ